MDLTDNATDCFRDNRILLAEEHEPDPFKPGSVVEIIEYYWPGFKFKF